MTGKNPWGNYPENSNGSTPPRRPQSGHGNQPPELEEMITRMRDMFGAGGTGSKGGQDPKKPIIIAAIILGLLWLASGIYIVQPGHHGVVQRFGAWDRTKDINGPGYHLPWPIESVQIVNVQEVRRLPIGIDGAGLQGNRGTRGRADENLMLTSDANIVDISIEVQWNIKSSENFLFKVANQEETIKKVGESAAREIVAQTPMTPIITTQRSEVADRILTIMQEQLDSYDSGVHIERVLIQNASVHPDVQQAFNDVQGAKQDAENVQNQAERYEGEILPVARGEAKRILAEANAYKEAKVAQATGDAQRFEDIYAAYLSGQDVTKERIYIETMEEVLRNAQVTVIDSEGNGSGVIPFLPLDRMRRE